MGSVWFSKKAFLYFGGAAIILIGGAIVLMAPYHYINFSVTENETRTFNVWDKDGYYPQVEFSVSVRYGNTSNVEIGLLLRENSTLDTIIINISLSQDNLVETNSGDFLEASIVENIPYGNYTVLIDQVLGAGLFDLGLKQESDSKLFIGVGGSMNIIGFLMGIGGYFVPGQFLPTDSDTIVEWGYDENEEEDDFPDSYE
ncbi:MAG: hypothetical protein ACFFEK_05280 [Candidatus Thorarchaeota archaeon]